MMECVVCGCRTHPHCYGYLMKPSSPWLCQACEDVATELCGVSVEDTFFASPGKEAISATIDTVLSYRRQIKCCVCGISEGALVPTPFHGVYCHVCCGVWLKELGYSNHVQLPHHSVFDSLFFSPRHAPLVVNPTTLSDEHCNGVCQFCQRQGGVVCCSVSGCKKYFHVMCGYANGVYTDFMSSGALQDDFKDSFLLSSKHTAFCSQHSAVVSNAPPPNNALFVTSATVADCTCFSLPAALAKLPLTSLLQHGSRRTLASSQHASVKTVHGRGVLEDVSMFDDLLEVPSSLLRAETTTPSVLVHSRVRQGRKRKSPVMVDNVPVIDIRGFGSVALEPSEPSLAPLQTPSLTPSQSSSHAPSLTSSQVSSQVSSQDPPLHRRSRRERTGGAPQISRKRGKVEDSPKNNSNNSKNAPKKELTVPAKKQLYKSCVVYVANGKQTLPANLLAAFSYRQITRTPAVLLKHFMKSPLFLSFFDRSTLESLPPDDTSPCGYIRHYYSGVPREVLESCLEGELDVSTLIQSGNQNMEPLNTVLDYIERSKNATEMVCLLRVLLISSMYSIYPPHVVGTEMAKKGGMLARSVVVEVRHLSRLVKMLGELALSLSNYVLCIEDPEEYGNNLKRADYCPQCLCLGEDIDDALVCANCGICYHSECLGLQKTSYSDLLQTKLYGYWSLERGFVCPSCCSDDLFEQSRLMKGTMQIRDSVVLAWQSRDKKKKRK